MKSNTGRAIGSALKTQAIDTAKNLATDVLLGNNLKEGLNREAKNIRARAADGIQKLATAHNPYVAEDDSELERKHNRKQKVKSAEEDPRDQKLIAAHNPYVAEDDSELEHKHILKEIVKSVEEDRSKREPIKKKRKQKQKVKRRPRTKLEWEELLNLNNL